MTRRGPVDPDAEADDRMTDDTDSFAGFDPWAERDDLDAEDMAADMRADDARDGGWERPEPGRDDRVPERGPWSDGR